MIAIQIKKIKFYYTKSIIILLRPPSLGSALLGPTSLGPTSAGPSGDGAGAAVEMDEGTSASGVDCECEYHHCHTWNFWHINEYNIEQ